MSNSTNRHRIEKLKKDKVQLDVCVCCQVHIAVFKSGKWKCLFVFLFILVDGNEGQSSTISIEFTTGCDLVLKQTKMDVTFIYALM